ncbi:MAG: GAF domain-containing protein [Anaerolineae bacterium]
MPAGVRLVTPRLPPSRRQWRQIHNWHRLLVAVFSILAIATSSIHAGAGALLAVTIYAALLLITEVASSRLGGERFYAPRTQVVRILLNLVVATAILLIVYSQNTFEIVPQAAGLWLIMVLAILPAARHLETPMIIGATVAGGILLILAMGLSTSARRAFVLDNLGVIVPLVTAHIFWLGTLLYAFRVSLRALATREQGFEDALKTLSNIAPDQMSAQAVCDEVAKRIARRSLYEYVLIALYDEESVAPDDKALEIVAVAGAPPDQLIGFTYPVTRGITARAVVTRTAQLVNDVDRDPQRRFLPHHALPRVKAECAVPIMLGERVLGVLDVEGTQPKMFEREDIDLLQLFASQLALVLAQAQQTEFQSSLRQAMKQILGEGATRSMMEQLAGLANQVLKADSTIIYLCEPTKDVWQGPFWGGDVGDPEHYQRRHVHTDSMLRWLIEYPETVYARDAQDLLKLANPGRQHTDTSESAFIVQQKVRSVTAAPLRAGSAPVGVMFVNYRRERRLGRAFRDMANAFFDVAGIAALNCHLYTRARSAGRQDALEDLHDGLSQIINYQMRTRLQQIAEANWLAEQPAARQAVTDIERALATASDLVRRLKDRPDRSQPMREMLNWIGRNLSGLDASVTCRIQSDAHVDHRPVRGWMAQEVNYILLQAVANAVQHAQASRILVVLSLADSHLRATVVDDGQGFDINQEPSHRGLYNMRNRAIKLGGQLHVTSDLGSGTCVTFNLPLDVLLRPPVIDRERELS